MRRLGWMDFGRRMARRLIGRPRRGEIWLYEFKRPDKRRPVVVLSRQEALPRLHTAIVAPITSTIRGLRSEVPVGVEDGLKRTSAVSLDNVRTIEQSGLRQFVSTLSERKMAEVCDALAFATGCSI